MSIRRSPSLLVSVLALAPWAGARAQELPPVAAAMARLCGDLRLEGAGLVVLREEGELHRSRHGDLAADTELPIASASKWLAVATVLTLVDDGLLDLDVPVGRYVKEFDRADKRSLTLRLCLACTGGVAPRLPDRMRGWTMQRFAEAAADLALRSQPGTAFEYGGVGFQIAAVAAERVTGKSWHELFSERIAGPLELGRTRFGTLLPPGGEAGTAALPWVAGGAVSTLDDYARFLRMLASGGRANGRQVLAATSVQAMWRDQVSPLVEVRPVGFEAADVRYGLGTWIERLPGGGERVSDPGAFGFTPWLDLDLQVAGVLAVRDRVGRVLPHLRRVQDAVRQAVQSAAVAGTTTTVRLSHGGRDRRYHLHLPPAAQDGHGVPLLLVLHGGGGSGEQVRESTGLAERAVRAGFAVAFPDGTGPLRSRLLTWNSGGVQAYAAEHDVDDTGFLRAVVADVQKRAAIDPLRVFAAGHSNGGMMCHRLAREAADVFRGIAVVAGAMDSTAADSDLPIAVLIVHGTADEHVRYEGGAPTDARRRARRVEDASVQQAVDYYLARNDVRGYPATQQDGKVRIDTYANARAGGAAAAPVRVITLEGGGHAWPGAERSRWLADVPFPFDANGAILEFFAGLPPRPPQPPQSPAAPR
ncbi:MAG: alpha/beta fold hydrolase [Planctomycetes bacterium]|nr:alpha/beta fold hydrolase [Planctomycetota bacterium]